MKRRKVGTKLSMAETVEHLAAGGRVKDRDGDVFWLDTAGRLCWSGLGGRRVRGAFDFTVWRGQDVNAELPLPTRMEAFVVASRRDRGRQG